MGKIKASGDTVDPADKETRSSDMDRRKILLCVVWILMLIFLSGIFYCSVGNTEREHSGRSTLVYVEVRDDKTGKG